MSGMSDVRPSAMTLIATVARGADRRFSSVIEEFAAALEDAHIFAALSWPDAYSVAEVIVSALTQSDHPANVLRDYADNTTLNRDRFLNEYKARRALVAAAKLYAMRVYGYQPRVVRSGPPETTLRIDVVRRRPRRVR